jgi:hypothetical protein
MAEWRPYSARSRGRQGNVRGSNRTALWEALLRIVKQTTKPESKPVEAVAQQNGRSGFRRLSVGTRHVRPLAPAGEAKGSVSRN